MLIWQALRNRQSSVNCSASLLLRAFMMFRYAAFLFLSNTKQDVTGIILFPPYSLLKRDYLKLNLSISLLVECNNLLIMFQKSGHK